MASDKHITLHKRYFSARMRLRDTFSKMRRNYQRKQLETEAAYLINFIDKYVYKNSSDLMSYAIPQLKKLEGMARKRF